jgi:hypothetical protein
MVGNWGAGQALSLGCWVGLGLGSDALLFAPFRSKADTMRIDADNSFKCFMETQRMERDWLGFWHGRYYFFPISGGAFLVMKSGTLSSSTQWRD